jgi:hypothetical protein
MNAKDNRLRARPVPKDNLNKDYPNIAGTRGAPKPALESSVGPGKTISNPEKVFKLIEDMLTEVREKNGIAFAAVSVLTHHYYINQLAAGRAVVLVDKFSPTPKLVRHYNAINAGLRRNELPGDVFKHLKCHGFDDRGMIDGIRMVGSFKETMRMRHNETRPNMHEKFLVTLLPNRKVLKPHRAITCGSMNWSYNALNSFEAVDYSEDPKRAQYCYNRFGYLWSLSEGLYDFNRSVTPRFDYKKSAVKYSSHPTCKECKNKEFAPYWWQPKNAKDGIRMLRCTGCNAVIPL